MKYNNIALILEKAGITREELKAGIDKLKTSPLLEFEPTTLQILAQDNEKFKVLSKFMNKHPEFSDYKEAIRKSLGEPLKKGNEEFKKVGVIPSGESIKKIVNKKIGEFKAKKQELGKQYDALANISIDNNLKDEIY